MKFSLRVLAVLAMLMGISAGMFPANAAASIAPLNNPDTIVVKQDAAVAESLMSLERAIGDANVRRDKAFFERVEADEFLFTGSDGSLTTRAEDLAGLDVPRSPKAPVIDSYVVDDMRVRLYGGSAVVWGRVTVAGKRADDSAFRNQSRFTDCFVWRDGRWQLVAGHSSRVPTSTVLTGK